jgi:predicted RNA binding protein YcfA (HicA-like mRNA interferase family)
MHKLYSTKQILKVLLDLDFIYVNKKRNHWKYRKYSRPPLTVIIPKNKREIPKGVFDSILKQADINEKIFKQILNGK